MDIYRLSHGAYAGTVPDLLTALIAFVGEHRRCGVLEAGVEATFVWMTCDCGGELARTVDKPCKDT